MVKRLQSAFVAIVVLFLIMFSGREVIAVCGVVLSLMCLYEVFQVFSYHKNPVFMILGIISAITTPYLDRVDEMWMAPIIILYVIVLSLYMIIHNKSVSVKDITMVFFTILIIPFCFSHIIYLRNLKNGEFYVWLSFIGAFCTDTMAYFVGCSVGGRKLCESISPKKTVSGAIGGIFGAFLGFFIYSIILKYCFQININPLPYYLIAGLCGIVAQIGDLTASAIKRSGNIKDFGNLMPGHGGIMDRVDSLMFVAPVTFYMVCIFQMGVLF